MHIVTDLEPDRPATAARRLAAPAADRVPDDVLLRWLRAQFLALPHVPSVAASSSPSPRANENLAN